MRNVCFQLFVWHYCYSFEMVIRVSHKGGSIKHCYLNMGHLKNWPSNGVSKEPKSHSLTDFPAHPNISKNQLSNFSRVQIFRGTGKINEILESKNKNPLTKLPMCPSGHQNSTRQKAWPSKIYVSKNPTIKLHI